MIAPLNQPTSPSEEQACYERPHDHQELVQAYLLGLKQALQALAMPAPVQLQLFPPARICPGCELYGEVASWGRWVLRWCQADLSSAQREALQALPPQLLAALSIHRCGQRDELLEQAEWARLRQLAAAALAAFGWEQVRPALLMA